MAKNNAITSKQLMFILLGVIGIKVFTMPAITVKAAGQDAWIAVIAGTVFPLLSLFLIERSASRLPAASFTEMNRLLFGKWLGAFFVVAFSLYILYANLIFLRYAAVSIQIFLLPRTPLLVILGVFLLFTIYVANKGLTVLGRFSELLFSTVVVMAGMMLYLAWIGGDYTALLPVGCNGAAAIATGALESVYAYSGMETLFVFYWFVTRREEVIRAGVTAVFISCVFYVVIVTTLIAVFEVEWVNNTFMTTIILFKTQQISLVERLDFFILMIWIGVAVRPLCTWLLASFQPISQLLGEKSRRYHLLIICSLGLVSLAGTQLMSDTLAMEKTAKMATPLSIGIQLGYPLLVYVVTLIRGKGVQASG